MFLNHRHPLIFKFAVFAHPQKRKLAWMLDGRKFASVFQKGKALSHNVKRHSSRLIKKLGDTEMRLQHNKVHNIKLCLPHLDDIIIGPGESLSFCRLVGNAVSATEWNCPWARRAKE